MNAPSTDAATHPGALVERTRREPDRIALRFRTGSQHHEWDRARLAAEIEAAVRAAVSMGLQPGDRVALLAPTSVDWYVTALAVQIAGGITVGVYPTSSAHQIQYILGHAGCRFAFVGDQSLLEAVVSVAPQLPDLERIAVFDDPGNADDRVLWWPRIVDAHRTTDDPLDRLEQLVAALDPDQLCTIVYTSGTTGEPKGALHSFSTIGQISRTVAPALGYEETDEYLVYLPMSHTAEQQNTLVLGSAIGWTLNFSSLTDLLDDLPTIRPSVMFAVPRILEKLRAGLEDAGFETHDPSTPLRVVGLDRLRILLAGGAPLDAGLLASFANHGVQIRNGYGMTEGSGIAMPWSTAPRVDTVGTALPGVEIRLADDGEILVRSSGVCLGYYRDADETSRMRDESGFLRTGDLGKFTVDGELQIVGRKKDVLITRGGKNITPSGLETKLAAHTFIRRAVLIGNDRPYLVALVELDDDAVGASGADAAWVTDALDAHITAVNDTVSRPEQIKRFHVLTTSIDDVEGALTPTMKLRRRAVEDAFAVEIDALYSQAPH